MNEAAAVLIVFLILFGALGTLARYGLQGWVQFHSDSGFPTGTLVVNLVGSFLLGGVTRFALEHLWVRPEWRIALSIGFLGAFTTFPTFSWETARMLQEGEWLNALIYAGASAVGGVVLAVIGMKVAELI